MKAIFNIAALAFAVLAQDAQDQVSVPFADVSKAGVVEGRLSIGCFSVEAGDSKEIVIEGGGDLRQRPLPGTGGLKRLGSTSSVTVETNANVVKISGPSARGVVLRVPAATALKLNCTTGGEMTVKGIKGDLDLDNVNSGIRVTGAEGGITAHSLHGKLTIEMDKVPADKPFALSTLNGDIDVTLPADAKAKLSLSTRNGQVYTDFDVKLETGDKPAKVGSINGGGPEMKFETVNGMIFLRQKKAPAVQD
jgi:hypothetical protein